MVLLKSVHNRARPIIFNRLFLTDTDIKNIKRILIHIILYYFGHGTSASQNGPWVNNTEIKIITEMRMSRKLDECTS